MQTTLYNLDGDPVDEIELPSVFETTVRPDLIRRAVSAAQANRKQDYGADEYAGLRTSAESPGSGRGMAHVPQSNGSGARVPQTVGGRKAHPPNPKKDRTKSINDKERKQAIRAAIAATADPTRVAERGHEFATDSSLPVVVSDDFEELVKTKAVVSFLEAAGLSADIERADAGRSVRSGRGTTRGRKHRTPASILFVTSSDAGPSRAARNLAGADVATGREVDTEELAPGGVPGRLTVYTQAALTEVADR